MIDDFPEIHPHRLMVAAHEVGHLVAWRIAGWTVTQVRLEGRGANTTGTTSIDRKQQFANLDHHRGYVVGLLAGIAAGERWCTDHNLSLAEHRSGCAVDLDVYRPARRDLQNAGDERPTTSKLRADARGLVNTHWRLITRLAIRLAQRGSLDPTQVPT
ncbi:hypothetical protein, partial [Amycolatopsis sp. NPDC058986]